MPGDVERTVEQRLRAAVESAPSGLLMTNAEGAIVLVNREVERLFGYSREELLGQSVERLIPERYRRSHPGYRSGFVRDPKARAMGAGRDLFGLRKDGTEVPVEIGLNPIVTEEGVFVLGSVVDISARKRAEEERARLDGELRQSQRMVAVGTLAGGVAHDFNNILSAIVGFGELLRDRLQDRPEALADLSELLGAAARGKQVIERILRFSRREETVRRPIDLAQPVVEVVHLLRSTLPATVDLRLHVGEGSPRVLADATGVQQILMNLATNASHAMPAGGTLTIDLEPCYVRDSTVRRLPELREGPHAKIEVRDSGHGMPPEVARKAFEPLFTTKEAGSGSGLGLAMVRTLIREHEGAVEIESEPGTGTTVRCFFPAIAAGLEEPPARQRDTPPDVPAGCGQRILFVDDEAVLAELGVRRLSLLGYVVVAETDPAQALARIAADPGAFDLVVTDHTMRGWTGVQLMQRVRALRPDLPAVLLTGNLDDVPEEQARGAGIRAFQQKPLTLAELAAVVAEVLKGPSEG